MDKTNRHAFETRAIHAGQEPDPQSGAVVTPIVHASTFVQDGIGENRGYIYARSGNPTRHTVERCIADLEGAEAGYAFPTGLSAAATILELLDAGAHIVAHGDLYGGVHRLLTQVRMRSAGFDVTFVDFSDTDAVRAAVTEKTAMLWYETPSNPTLRIVDIAAISQIGREANALTVCDNTFCSPYLQNPLALGADIVMHSATKFLCGHSDMMAGIACVGAHVPAEINERLGFLQNSVGAVLSPPDCAQLLRSVKTLPVRMDRHSSNARAVAEHFAENRDRFGLADVRYPGLPDHPGHEIAARQMRDFGAIVTIEVAGGEARANEVLKRTSLFQFAVSLGGVESLIQHPASLTHKAVPEEERAAAGISGGMIRLSVGIEHVTDLIADLEEAFR